MVEIVDAELIERFKGGDKAAFGQLVLRYQPMVERLAHRLMGNADRAEELAQEAMLQAYLSLPQLRDTSKFKSWLYGIVLNLCRNELRHRRLIYLSLETTAADWVESTIVDQAPSPQQRLESEELQTTLLDAVNRLSEKNRLATLLFYQEQRSLQEIADQLDISINAVKSRLHKSRHQLREQLAILQDPQSNQVTQKVLAMTIQTESHSTEIPTEIPIEQPVLCCSFCGKDQDQVETLIAGIMAKQCICVYICNECVDTCNQILSGQVPPLTKEEADRLTNQ